LTQARQPPITRNEVEEIAVFPGHGIRPFTGHGGLAIAAAQAHIEAAAGMIVDIADDPAAAGSSAVREMVPADARGALPELPGEIGGIVWSHKHLP
jgi:hypothetical protein